VATGRRKPTSPVASYHQNINTCNSNDGGASCHNEVGARSLRDFHQSHACKQVATGRRKPTSPVASYHQNINTCNSNVPPPSANA
ncbi:MAG: hypothetical protein ACK5PZ_13280, partial [Pirellula sp.]